MDFWRPLPSLEKERKIRRREFVSSIKRSIRKFHVLVMQCRQRNVPKRVMHVRVVVLVIKPIAFLTFSLPSPSSLLKLPFVSSVDGDLKS